jgi:hypothetical protein
MSCTPLTRGSSIAARHDTRTGWRKGLLSNFVEKMMSHMFSDRRRVFVAAISLLAGGGLLVVGAVLGQAGDPGPTNPSAVLSGGLQPSPQAELPVEPFDDYTFVFVDQKKDAGASQP